MNKKFPLYLSFAAVLVLLLVTAPAMARVLIDENGDVVINQGQVLSSGSGSDGSGSDDDSSGSGSSGSGSEDEDDDSSSSSGSGSGGADGDDSSGS